jgi:hypothetical protein
VIWKLILCFHTLRVYVISFIPFEILESNVRAQEAAPTRSAEDLWDEVGPKISAVLQNDGNVPSDVIPFDAASDRDMDEQK